MISVPSKSKIAIIGSGISGLTCAYLLHKEYDVHIFETNDYLGGHTQTTDVEVSGKSYPVNTGFIVFNDWTYPNFIRMMNNLGIASEESDMSFSVKCKQSGMEYNGHDFNSLFAKRSNLLNIKFWWMLREILRFNKATKEALKNENLDKSQTLGDYLNNHKYSDYFRRYYIIPMGAAVWSAGEEQMMAFPLYFFVRFFNNHGMLNIDDRPQWRVVSNGSRTYVDKIIDVIGSDQVHINTPVVNVSRHADHIDVQYDNQNNLISEKFDHIIFSCHSDQALNILSDASEQEKDILGAIPYQMNEVVLHTDSSILPRHKAAWASWNYHIDSNRDKETVAVSYYMNRLQNFHQCPVDFCVTLNKTEDISPDKIIRKFQYAHPVFTLEGMKSQQRHHEINNINNTHYCGAYWFNGFHEDGVNSALRVCEHLGVTLDNMDMDNVDSETLKDNQLNTETVVA